MYELEVTWFDWRQEEEDYATINCDKIPDECPVCFKHIVPLECAAIYGSSD